MNLARRCAIFIILCMAFSAAGAYAGDFSADMVSSSPQQSITMKILI